MNRLLSLFVVAALVLSACAKKETITEPVDTGGNTSSKNSFVVDGNGFSNTSFRAYNDETYSNAFEDLESGSGSINYSGTIGNNSTNVFGLSIVTAVVRTGTFTIDEFDLALVTTDGNLQTATYVLESGTVTVTQWDNVGGRCKGTFSGVARHIVTLASITISNGKFDCRVVADVD